LVNKFPDFRTKLKSIASNKQKNAERLVKKFSFYSDKVF
jgi:hypothetical protein